MLNRVVISAPPEEISHGNRVSESLECQSSVEAKIRMPKSHQPPQVSDIEMNPCGATWIKVKQVMHPKLMAPRRFYLRNLKLLFQRICAKSLQIPWVTPADKAKPKRSQGHA